MSISSLFGLGSLLTSSTELLQTSSQHRLSQELERRHHEEEMRQMKEQHKGELQLARQTYLLSAYTDIEQYFQELNENLINGSRDAERDMVDQRNQQFQTILIAATMMLTALLSVLYQGIIPNNSKQFYFVIYSTSTSLGLLVLLASILLSMIIIKRVNSFMYRRSRDTIDHLTQAMEQTKHMMKHIRGDVLSLVQPNSVHCTVPVRVPIMKQASNHTIYTHNTEEDAAGHHHVRKKLTGLEEIELEEEWQNHEDEVYKYLERRNRINERLELMAVDLNNQYRMSFEHYWKRYCGALGDWALLFFYLGTTLMLIQTTSYMCSIFFYGYHSETSAVVAVTVLSTAVVLCVGLAIYLRYCDHSINQLREMLNSEFSQDSAAQHGRMLSFLRRSSSRQSGAQDAEQDTRKHN